MDNMPTHFAKSIKRLRKALGLSQEEFGKRIGVAKTTICNYEKGVSTPTVNTLEHLSFEFGLPVSYFTDPSPDISEKGLQKLLRSTIPLVENKSMQNILDISHFNIARSVSVPLRPSSSNDSCFATTISDNSMNKLGVKKGTIFIVDKDAPINNNDIIAVIYNGNITLRRYHETAYGKYISTESTKMPMSLSKEPITKCDMVVGKVIKFILDAKDM